MGTKMRGLMIRPLVLPLAAALWLGSAGAALADCNRQGGTALAPTVVHFDTDSTVIKPEYRKELNEVAEQNRGNPNMKICIEGQADKQGNAAYNEKLALRRAEAVAAYLEKQGLPRKLFDISTRGEAFGEGLVSDLLGNDEAQSDRRVEVLVIRF